MKVVEMKECLAWIDSNLSTAPEYLQGVLASAQKKLNTNLERTSIKAELEEKKEALAKAVAASREEMKAIELQINEQRELVKARRLAEQTAKKEAEIAKKAEVLARKEARLAKKK